MQITNEMLARYVGGQMEIQNQDEGYLYRGEIEAIGMEDNNLQAKFKWLAKGEGFPPLPSRWINNERLDYFANLEIYTPSDIGDGRLCFNSFISGETVVLYPPNGSKLDPTKVEGLVLQ